MALGVILLVKRKLELNKKRYFRISTTQQNKTRKMVNDLETKFRFPKPNKQKISN